MKSASRRAAIMSIHVALAAGSAAQVQLVSRAAPSTAINTGSAASRLRSRSQQVSADGRYVVFASQAQNLVLNVLDDNAKSDVFLYDRMADTVTLLSYAAGQARTASGESEAPSISADGSTVAFLSTATDLVAGQSGGGRQVFAWSRATGQVLLVSHAAGVDTQAANGNPTPFDEFTLSADGALIAYEYGGTNVVSGQNDTNGGRDIFLWSRATNTNTLVSHSAAAPQTTGSSASSEPALSADGTRIAYSSGATNLVAGQVDANASTDVFLYATGTGLNRLVSHTVGSAVTTGDGESRTPSISADGGAVAFLSASTNLVVASDSMLTYLDAFLFDVAADTNTLVSHVAGNPSQAAGGGAFGTAIDAAGSVVAFVSRATNLVPGQISPQGYYEAFVWTRATSTSVLASHAHGSPATGTGTFDDVYTTLQFAGDGRYLLFETRSPALIPAPQDSNTREDFYLYDRVTGTNHLVSSVNGAGTVAVGYVWYASISSDGNFIAFDSQTNFVVTTGGTVDANAAHDVFLFDRAAAVTTLVSRARGDLSASAGQASVIDGRGAVSANGRYAVFTSSAENLLPTPDANGCMDIFLADLVTGQVRLVSRSATDPQGTTPGCSFNPVVSGDGSRVAFLSKSTQLVAGTADTNAAYDLFLWERDSGVMRLVSHVAGTPLQASNRGVAFVYPYLSSSGDVIVYASNSSDIVPLAVDSLLSQIYLYDVGADQTWLVSHAAGATTTPANGAASPYGLSADGRYVTFASSAPNLLAGQIDSNGNDDVFVYDRVSATTTLMSRAHTGGPATTANGASSSAVMSGDGTKIAFISTATNLVPGFVDGNGISGDAYLVDRASANTALITHVPADTTQGANGPADLLAISADSLWVSYVDAATNLVPGQSGSGFAVFLYSTASNQNQLVSHAAGSPTQVSAPATGAEADRPSISADGSFVSFASKGANLVAGQVDSNGGLDVFLYERASGTNRLMSRTWTSAVTTGNAPSWTSALSADGRAVVLNADATNLVPRDFNARTDVFVAWNDQGLPSNPMSLGSTSHTPGVWSALSSIVMQWAGASDPESGLAGYSVQFDNSSTTTPDALVEVAGVSTSSAPLADGSDHWFHLRTCDLAGNCAAALHRGPYWIDATAPSTPTNVLSTSHTPGAPSSDTTIDVAWTGASDAGAGLDGYGIAFRGSATPQCEQIKRVEAGVTSFTSAALPDGNHWVHVCALDNVGNWSVAAVAGPYRVATNADLGVMQTATPEPASAHGTLTYTVTVTNHGGLDASDVVLTDTLPPALTFVSSTPGAPTCTHVAAVVTCDLGNLAFGDSAVVTISMSIAGLTGSVPNNAEVHGAQVDLNAANNVSVHETRIVLEKGDINNDARADIFFRNESSGRHVAWLMDGPVRQTAGFVSPDPVSPDWRLAVVHDVNGDLRSDLVFQNTVSGAVEFWLMQGLVRQGAPLTLASTPGSGWTLQASADFDHDGKADLLWRHAVTQALTIWTMNGTTQIGTLVPNPDHAVDSNWQLTAAQDVSDDSNIDLVWYNISSGRVVQWLLDANAQRLSGRFTTPAAAGDANWKVVGAANYGGDSSPLVPWNDLLWRNETSGRLVVWQMNDLGQRVAGMFTNPAAPADATNWRVVGPR